MLRESEGRINMGYDYNTNGLIKRFLSPLMYFNPRLSTFLNMIDPLFIEILNAIKKLQFYHNYTIDKNDTRYNQ